MYVCSMYVYVRKIQNLKGTNRRNSNNEKRKGSYKDLALSYNANN